MPVIGWAVAIFAPTPQYSPRTEEFATLRVNPLVTYHFNVSLITSPAALKRYIIIRTKTSQYSMNYV